MPSHSAKYIYPVLIMWMITAQMWSQGGATGAITGTVQDPSGAVVANAEVKLLISTGPSLVNVPNVVGQAQAAAEAALTGAGFNVEETFVVGGPGRSGKVLTQNPAGGQQPKGATVAITIGR